MMDDRDFMRMALQLAKKGMGRVSPNPMVGAVIVEGGRVVSKGYHAQFGGPHAEIEAIRRWSPVDPSRATLYVTLEPCVHHGKTPPCVDAILDAGIGRVVIGMVDPNPLVLGRGIQRLREAGVTVLTGVLESECRALNAPFVTWVTKRRPLITLKIAQSLDARIALPDGRSRWITSEHSRTEVQRLRKAHDAVLVGIGTVLRDDPLLTIRIARIPNRRIVLDSRLRIPLSARLLHLPDPKNTILVTTVPEDSEKERLIRDRGVQVWYCAQDPSGHVNLENFLRLAAEAGITSILVEGGKTIFTAFMRLGCVDRVIVFIAPRFFGEGLSPFGDLGVETPEEGIGFSRLRWRKCGPDLMVDGWR